MSSIESTAAPVHDTEELLKVYAALDAVARSLISYKECINKGDLSMADNHLKGAECHAAEAKRFIAASKQAGNKTYQS